MGVLPVCVGFSAEARLEFHSSEYLSVKGFVG
jgi:hypothetical protein